MRSIEAQILQAELRGDESAWRRLQDLDTRRGGGWSQVMPTAVNMTAWRRFGSHDLRLITRFAQRLAETSDGDNFRPGEVEAVIRGVLGEDLLLGSVDPSRAGAIMHMLLFALVDDLELDDDQIDDLLAAADRTVEDARQAAAAAAESPGNAPMLDGRMRRRTRRRYLSDDDLQAAWKPDTSPAQHLRRAAATPRSGGRRSGQLEPATLGGRWVIASMLRQRDDRLRLEARLKRPGIIDMPLMVRAAFAVAVPRHFPPDAHIQEIADMAAATRTFHDQLDLMGTEYLIRAALGEDVPDHGMDVRTEIATKTLVLGTIADWWQRDEARLLDVVIEAEQILADQGYALAVSDH